MGTQRDTQCGTQWYDYSMGYFPLAGPNRFGPQSTVLSKSFLCKVFALFSLCRLVQNGQVFAGERTTIERSEIWKPESREL